MSARLSTRALSVAAAFRELGDPSLGGVVIFVGRVRADPSPAGRVAALVYETHRAPALRALTELEAEVQRRFAAGRTVAWHRVGRVRVGEVAVIVGAACGHRAQAFAAASFLIDRLKRTVPVWKEVRARRAHPPRPRRSPRRARGAG